MAKDGRWIDHSGSFLVRSLPGKNDQSSATHAGW